VLVLTGVVTAEARNTYRTERVYRLAPAPGESCDETWIRHRPRAADDARPAEKAALASSELPANTFIELRNGLCIVTLFSRSIPIQ
jgi:hypothetical protein